MQPYMLYFCERIIAIILLSAIKILSNGIIAKQITDSMCVRPDSMCVRPPQLKFVTSNRPLTATHYIFFVLCQYLITSNNGDENNTFPLKLFYLFIYLRTHIKHFLTTQTICVDDF